MNKQIISFGVYLAITIIFGGCGLWVQQLSGMENMSYGLLLMIYIVPAAAFIWGAVMACLQVKPLWLWPLLTGLWEVIYVITMTDILRWENGVNWSADFAILGGLYLASALPAAVMPERA